MADINHTSDLNISFDLLDDTELMNVLESGDLDNKPSFCNDDVTVTQVLTINTQDLVLHRKSTREHGSGSDENRAIDYGINAEAANSCRSLVASEHQLAVDSRQEECRRRFGSPISEQAIRQKNVGAVPKDTRKVNDWSTKVWSEWTKHRNSQPVTPFEPGFPIPEDIGQMNDELINYWGQRFVMEIKRQDGTDYPPNSLHQLVCGLQRYLRNECNRPYVNFLKEGTQFNDFRKCLDTRMIELFSAGVGAKRLSSDPVTMDDEVKLWESKVFNSTTATGLSNAVFFYNVKLFGFRGFQEHVNAQANQFDIILDTEHNLRYILFTPGQRKNSQGGIKGRRCVQDPIRHYEQPDRAHNLVDLYERYLSLIPRAGPFYRKPLEGVDENNNPKFSCATIPQNGLKSMLKRFYEEAGIDTRDRKITNHSARVALCTTLYNQKFTDKAVISRSKHKSNAVQAYQREQFEILNNISNALEPDVKKSKMEAPATTISPGEIKTELMTPAVAETSTGENAVDSSLLIHVPYSVKHVVIVKSDGKKISIDV